MEIYGNSRKLTQNPVQMTINHHSPDWNIKPLAVPHAVMAAVYACTSGPVPCLRAVFSSCRAICGCWPSWHAVMAALRITELPSTWVSWRWLGRNGWDGAKVKVNLDGLMGGKDWMIRWCAIDRFDMIWYDLIASSCLQLAQIPQCRQSEVVGSSPIAN